MPVARDMMAGPQQAILKKTQLALSLISSLNFVRKSLIVSDFITIRLYIRVYTSYSIFRKTGLTQVLYFIAAGFL